MFNVRLALRSTGRLSVLNRNYHSSFDSAPVLTSTFDVQSDLYKENYTQMKSLVDKLNTTTNYVLSGGSGSQKVRERHVGKGKLLARERIKQLIDPNSAFLELSQLAAYDVYGKDEVLSAGIVTGVGIVHGQECMIVANDATVKGGTYYPLTVKKHLRAQEIAWENRLPCIYLGK